MNSALRKAAAATLALLLSVSATIAGNSGVKAYASSINGSNADYAQFDRDRIQQPDSALVLIYGPDAMLVEAGKTYHITQRFLLTEGTRNYTDPVFIGKSEDDMVYFSKINVKPYDQYVISDEIKLRYNMAVEINYDITVSDLAKVGKISYGIIAYDSKPIGYDENKNASYANTGAFKISLDVATASSEPMFVLKSDPRFSAKAGEYLEIPVQMQNVGDMDAYDVYVSIGGNSSLVAADAPMKQKIGSTPHEGFFDATFKFLVEAEAKSERFNLPITVSCRDYSGATYTDSSYYVIVDLMGVEEFTRASSFIVKNVKQSPEKPKGGENVTLTFDLENNGDTDFRNIKLLLGNVSSSAFEPIDSNPYILVGDLAARTTKKMTVTYKCGNSISGGTNGLVLNFTAQDKHGANIDGSATVYVLNVVPGRSSGDSGSVSKPKLMVTDFTTDVAEILAGSKFEFRFNVKNTNEETVARNIKVKVTSQSFSVTAGSNTFFVSDILPGEEKEISINLKASSSLQTGAYPINVEMEYEYDAETKNNETGNSVTANDEILMQVSELLRAQCENIQIGDWNIPTLGATCPLTFEFYNMGRSSLSNVYVTVEGDFELATGNSHYIGNIGPGSPEFVECTVRPLISGNAECRIVIHMEDSNGDEVTKENSTFAFVSDGQSGNGGTDIGIIDFPTDPGMSDPGMSGDQNGEEKKIGAPVIAGSIAAVVVIAIIITVVVIRKKKRSNSEDEFDD